MKKPVAPSLRKMPKLTRSQVANFVRVRRRVRGTRRLLPATIITGLVIVAGIAVLLVMQGPSMAPVKEADAAFFQISTASPGGTYFPIGRTLGSMISHPSGAEPCQVGGRCGVPGLIATTKASPGSIANVRLVNAGVVDSALAQSDIVAWAYQGERMFEKEGFAINLRAIASLYPEAVQLVATRASGIAHMNELRGKRVSIGREGSGTRADALLILEAYGMEPSDLVLVEVDALEASDLVQRGELDAFFIIAGTPSLAVTDLLGRVEATLVPIDGPEVEQLLTNNKFFARDVVNAEAYKGIGETKTVSVRALWITHAGVDEKLVNAITKALWSENNRKSLDEGHPKAREIKLQTALDGVPLPLHRGARSAYVELGVTLPEGF